MVEAATRKAVYCKLPSGRYQARHLGSDGITRNADHTFETEKSAAQWLTLVGSEIIRGKLLAGGTIEPQAVKSYSLLRAILDTAVREDEILEQNPCRIPGYDRYHAPERPVATVAQVLALAEQMPPRYVALITAAAFSGLRWGQLAALRRCDVDLAVGTVRVPGNWRL